MSESPLNFFITCIYDELKWAFRFSATWSPESNP